MGPMCSIVYENEPAEKHAKITKTNTYRLKKELGISIVQGIGITIEFICVGPYKMEVNN
jgi:Ca2+-transporting ATPase